VNEMNERKVNVNRNEKRIDCVRTIPNQQVNRQQQQQQTTTTTAQKGSLIGKKEKKEKDEIELEMKCDERTLNNESVLKESDPQKNKMVERKLFCFSSFFVTKPN